jgi:hypothetical protein
MVNAMADEAKDDREIECITVVAREFTPAAMEYHRQRLGEQRYAIEGQIKRHKFYLAEGPGPAKELFDGEPYYAATFVRRKGGK